MTVRQRRQQQAANARAALAAKRAEARRKLHLDLEPADARYLLNTLNGDERGQRIKQAIIDQVFALVAT